MEVAESSCGKGGGILHMNRELWNYSSTVGPTTCQTGAKLLPSLVRATWYLGKVAPPVTLATRQAEAGGLQVQSQFGLHSKNLSQNKW